MRLVKIKNGDKTSFNFKSTKDLDKKLKNESFSLKEKTKEKDGIILSFKTDEDFKRLRLLVILSPILIASFDSRKEELGYFKENLEVSNFKYGLYPYFFQDFDLKDYLDFYKKNPQVEDIKVYENLKVDFYLNYLKDSYILSLVAMVEALILDDKTCHSLLRYFDKMRNDIVINGRRSILANGIQAFYLGKYVVVWALDLYKIIEKSRPDLYGYIRPIYKLTNNLKRPGTI